MATRRSSRTKTGLPPVYSEKKLSQGGDRAYDTESEDEDFGRTPIRKKKAAKRKPASALPASSKVATDQISDIFEAIKRPSCAVLGVVRDWFSRYEANSDLALVELLNFIFKSCGCQSMLPDDSDLDNIDLPDLTTDLVDEMEGSNGVDSYPILDDKKLGFNRFQSSFQEFWERFVRVAGGSLTESDLIETVIEWLTSASSCHGRPIRHTTTVAALEIGTGLVDLATEAQQDLLTAQRQLKSATQKKSKKRMAQLQESCGLIEQRMELIDELITKVFNGIFMHRYRDQFNAVRSASISTLGRWVCEYPDYFLKDPILKYFGWMMNDKDDEVRLCAVESLTRIYSDEEAQEKLELFTARFKDRMVQLTEDKSLKIAVEACDLMQHLAVADQLDDEDLNKVDRLVFAQDKDLRRAAAGFVQCHYEVLHPEDGEDIDAAAQLKTLLEIIALYTSRELLSTTAGRIPVFVDAFSESDGVVCLKDFDCLSSYLLQENDAEPLSERDQSLVVLILLESVRLACGRDTAVKPRNDRASKEERVELTEKFSTHLVATLPELIARFQADPFRVARLVELVSYMDLETYSTQRQQKMFKNLLKLLTDLFLQHGSGGMNSESFASVFCPELLDDHENSEAWWLQTDPTEADFEAPDRAVGNVLSVVATALVFLSNEDHAGQRSAQTAVSQLTDKLCKQVTKQVRSASRSKSWSQTNEFALVLVLRRLGHLITLKDSRGVASFTNVHQPLSSLLEARSTLSTVSSTFSPDTVCEALRILFANLTWSLSRADGLAGASDADEDEVSEAVEACASLRVLITESLERILDLTPDPEDEEWVTLYLRSIRAMAYSMFHDLRVLLTPKVQEEALLPLAWEPSAALLESTGAYFSGEMKGGDGDGEDPDDDHEKAHRVLLPLAKAVMFNPLKKEEAAQVAQYFVGAGPQCQTIVKEFSRQLRAGDPALTSTLAIQGVALQRGFIAALKEDGGEDDLEGDPEAVVIAVTRLMKLSKRFASSLGVGKFSKARATALKKFLLDGVAFAFEEPPMNLGYLDMIAHYLRNLKKSDCKELLVKVESMISEMPETTRTAIQDAGENNDDWGAILAFRRVLAGQKALPATTTPRHSSARRRAGSAQRRTPNSASRGTHPRRRLTLEALPEEEEEEENVSTQASYSDAYSTQESRSSSQTQNFEDEDSVPSSRVRLDSDDEDSIPPPSTPSSAKKRKRPNDSASPAAGPWMKKKADADSQLDFLGARRIRRRR